MRVCIGGTFNIIHKGHEILIDKAFEIAGENGTVFIGLTAGNLAEDKANIRPYAERKKNLEKYLTEKGFIKKAVIKSIKDKYGPALDEEFDAMVVSPETITTAKEINTKRARKGKKPIKLILVPFVLAEDEKPISSTRISRGEIDKNGKILQ